MYSQLCPHILEISADGIISTDAEHKIVVFSKGAQDIFGYTREEALGQPLNLLLPESFHRVHSEQMQAFADDDVESRFMGERREVFGRRKNGEEFHIEASIAKFSVDGKLYFTAIVRDVTGRRIQEQQMRRSLEEKEVLLKEVHHRVKNNLQLISSLLNLQARKSQDRAVSSAIEESQARIRTIALVHELLYRSDDLSRVNFAQYVKKLVANLLQSLCPDGKIHASIEAEPVELDIDKAVASGLIVNELVTNSLKHAFKADDKGEITVRLKRNQRGECVLSVHDNGCGLAQDIDLIHSQTLGVRLVTNLTRQLNGRVEFLRDSGTTVSVVFGVE